MLSAPPVPHGRSDDDDDDGSGYSDEDFDESIGEQRGTGTSPPLRRGTSHVMEMDDSAYYEIPDDDGSGTSMDMDVLGQAGAAGRGTHGAVVDDDDIDEYSDEFD